MFLKPLLKTLLLSSLIFILLVGLGMKYNWADYLKAAKVNDVELAIPEHPPSVNLNQLVEEEQSFDLQIIRNEKKSIIENMTKQQVVDACSVLYKKLGVQDAGTLDVAIGGCVVSNYKESIQNIENTVSIPKEKLLLIERSCQQQVIILRELSDIEKQLHYGVCVSDAKLK